jgi:hypothetical protein
MTANDEDCEVVGSGRIRFYDNRVPTLGVGNYKVDVRQRINPKGTQIDETYTESQFFSVEGPRFTLPGEDLYSIFPPGNAQGIFSQFLPHVVLSKADLPWERNIFREQASNQTPWMALLLFAEDEQIGGTAALLAPKVEGWKTQPTMTANIRASEFYSHSAGDKILWPKLKKEWYESDDFLSNTCSVIDISPVAFETLIPNKKSLRFLAHARKVNPTAKDASVLKVNGSGWYSVLIGSRLPALPAAGEQPKRNIAHLVSLEGFQDYVKDDKVELPKDIQFDRVRMISLKSWVYYCQQELGESFSELMNGLLKDATGRDKPTAFFIQADPPLETEEASTFAYEAIRNGYVPLRYETRLGEQTFAWYRGPFSPFRVKNFLRAATVINQQDCNTLSAGQRLGTASSFVIYDKAHGIFDLSYAVAWETGRLMALSDENFGQALLDWQHEGHRLTDMMMERSHQSAVLKAAVDFRANALRKSPAGTQALLQQVKPHAITDGFVASLLMNFSTDGFRSGGSPDAAADFNDSEPELSSRSVLAYADRPAPSVTPQSLAALLNQPGILSAISQQGMDGFDKLADWLARLYLLIGVPFENLVPNANLLTQESLRFFYVDSNWLVALIEGALSIGIESRRDAIYQCQMKEGIWNAIFAAMRDIRPKLFSDPVHSLQAKTNAPFDEEAMTGMLLRSQVVGGWPGLEVNAYGRARPGESQPDKDTIIKLLYMDRLSDDVMLCLWPQIPAVVTIDEPHEGIAFGFEDPPHHFTGGPLRQNGKGFYLYLRSVGGSNYGMPICSDSQIESGQCECAIDAIDNNVIDSTTRIVKISQSGGLLGLIKEKLPGKPDLNVRDFALEMVKVPEQAVFKTPPKASE